MNRFVETTMNPDQIRAEKRRLENEIGTYLAQVLKDFEAKTGMPVEGVAVAFDTLGSPGRDLQRHYDPPRVSVTLAGL
jgi:hypothetical protein